MTAEIAVLNKSAIALAADSAVTLSIAGGSKVYNTANKLFTLSKYNPVGIMLYGEATFMGVPWELIIKLYREQLRDRSFDSIDEYAADFLEFIEERREFTPSDSQQVYFDYLIRIIFDEVKRLVTDKVTAVITAEGSSAITEVRIETLLNEAINETEQVLKSKPELYGNDDKQISNWVNKSQAVLKTLREKIFQKLPISEVSMKRLDALIALGLKHIIASRTGIVIAGYGNQDIFPSVKSYQVEAVVNDKLRYALDPANSAEISFNQGARIVAFGQSEMVYTFLQGIDPSYHGLLDGFFQEVLNQYPQQLIDLIPGLDADQKRKVISEMQSQSAAKIASVRQEISKYQRDNYVQPIIRIAASLPKDELAAMAESLVNLTSFKRRVSPDVESVGGPIDVAVISKGDGFIWIKRKHYFDQTHNPHYATNYMRPGSISKKRGGVKKNVTEKKAK